MSLLSIIKKKKKRNLFIGFYFIAALFIYLFFVFNVFGTSFYLLSQQQRQQMQNGYV